jgi:hypothetical protein
MKPKHVACNKIINIVVTDRLRVFAFVLTSQQDVIRKEGYFTSVPLSGNICLRYIYIYMLHTYRHAYMYF